MEGPLKIAALDNLESVLGLVGLGRPDQGNRVR